MDTIFGIGCGGAVANLRYPVRMGGRGRPGHDDL